MGFLPSHLNRHGKEIDSPALLGISGGLEHFLSTTLILNESSLEAPVLRIVTPT